MHILAYDSTVPATFALGLSAGALALDWTGIGHQITRDRLAMPLAGIGLTGLLASAGWPGVATGHGSTVAAFALAGLITSSAGVVVALKAGEWKQLRRAAGRINTTAWLCVLSATMLLPVTLPPVVVHVAYAPWGRARPILGVPLLALFGLWWCYAAGVRPHLAVTRGALALPSPARLLDRLRAVRGYGAGSGSGSDSGSGRDRSRAVATGRPVAEPVELFGGLAIMDGEGDRYVYPRPVATGWTWRSAWRSMLAFLPPDALHADLPQDVRADEPWRAWIARQLDRKAPTTEIVKAARRQWGAGERTWYRRLDAVRRDRAA